jgi:Uma2 family endonuclease
MATIERVRMTPAEFKQLGETVQPTELIDGEVIVSPTPRNIHQESVGETYFFLKQLSRQNPAAGRAVIAPMDVWLGEDCVQPDVFWVSGEGSQCKLGEDGYWYGAPDLVVEVLSPSTAHRDRGVKFDLYEKHGVREYWLADPDGQYIEVYGRENERFVRVGVFTGEQTFSSTVLGVNVNVGTLLKS